MNVGAVIKNIRKSKGLSQIEVANKAGIAVNSLRLYEAGKRHPNVNQLQSIADALGVSISCLLNVTDENVETLRRSANEAPRLSRSQLSQICNVDGIPDEFARSDFALEKVEFFRQFFANIDKKSLETFLEGRLPQNLIEQYSIWKAQMIASRVKEDLEKLNLSGKEEAYKMVHELTLVEKYVKQED